MVPILHLRMLALALAVLATLTLAPAAWAHAQLLAVDPIDNAVLDTAPATVSLSFNEPVTPMALSLIGPDGTKADLLGNARAGQTVTIDIPATLGRGTHVLSWRVVSTDGHPIGGSQVFSIGAVTGSASVSPTTDRSLALLLWASKTLLFIALLGGVGGALFAATATMPAPARRIALLLCAVGIPLAALTLGLQGADALGTPLSSLLDPQTWTTGLSTSFGPTVITLSAAFLLAIAALTIPGALGITLAGIATLAGAASLALSGHASAADPQWLTRPAVAIHIASLLFWAGALVPLWFLLSGRSDRADHALARFSRHVPVAVAALLASGATLMAIQLGRPGPHWLSPYGAILAAKLTLLCALFGLALWNRQRLTAPTLAGDAMARYRLRRSVAAELLLVLLILGLVAGWRFTPPPRALAVAAASTAAPLHAHVMTDRGMADVSLSPGHAGLGRLELWLTQNDGMPMTAQDVAVTLSEPSLGIEPIKRSAVLEDGLWVIDDLTIPMAGTWRLEIDIRASRFDRITLQTDLTIP